MRGDVSANSCQGMEMYEGAMIETPGFAISVTLKGPLCEETFTVRRKLWARSRLTNSKLVRFILRCKKYARPPDAPESRRRTSPSFLFSIELGAITNRGTMAF